MVSNIVGKAVEGDDFFDRKREVARIWDRMETDNMLVLAPRRVGKTSLMYHLREEASKQNLLAAYLSVQDVTTE